jgi:hypothetical protein
VIDRLIEFVTNLLVIAMAVTVLALTYAADAEREAVGRPRDCPTKQVQR